MGDRKKVIDQRMFNLMQWIVRIFILTSAKLTYDSIQLLRIALVETQKILPYSIIIAIISVIFLLLSVYGGFFIGITLPENNIDWIMKIYPPLIKDLRTSIDQCVFDFHTSYGFIDRHFTLLRNYFRDSTVKAIEGYDSGLYLELVKIREETLPLLERVERSRRASLELIKENWIKILEEKETDINIVKFVTSLSGSIIWEIWRENFDIVKKGYDETISNLRAQVSNITPPPESTLLELIDSAKEEMNKVKSFFQQIEKQFQEIEENVIARMDETIKRQFTAT